MAIANFHGINSLTVADFNVNNELWPAGTSHLQLRTTEWGGLGQRAFRIPSGSSILAQGPFSGA